MSWGWDDPIDQIYALDPASVEQSRKIPLLQFIKTRFVPVAEYSKLADKYVALKQSLLDLKEKT